LYKPQLCGECRPNAWAIPARAPRRQAGCHRRGGSIGLTN